MIHVRTFGAVELRRGETEVSSVLSQPKRLALFIHILLASPSGWVNREALLARFWPESDAERARNSLRQALHYMRRSLGDDVIESRGDELGCRREAIRCDALDFVEALRSGRLEAGLQLYRGDFLPAFHVDDAPDVEAWLEEQRAWYGRQAFQAAGGLADSRDAAGDMQGAIEWARQACGIDPFDEAAARRLIRILAATGEAAGALAAYDAFEARLRREHEIEPSAETRALAASVRASATPQEPTAELTELTAEAPQEERVAGLGAPLLRPRIEAGAAREPLRAAEPAPTTHGSAVQHPQPMAGRPHLWHALRPVQAVAAVVLLLAGAAAWHNRPVDGPAVAPAVAVLPFVNHSGDAANDYLSDGLAEELLNVLTRVPGVKVAARTSTFSFKGRDVAVDSVARALRVTHVVEGSLRVVGTKLRVTVQLIEATTGFHVWSNSYDRDTRDILGVQDEIARDIAKSLQVQLSPAIARPPASETRDPEAYRLLLRANQVMRGGSTRETLAEAGALLDEALRRDPNYARAMAAMANVLSWQAQYRYTDPDVAYPRARELAARSVALAPTVEAHLVLARDAELQQWDTTAADTHYRSALEINPVDPRALQFRAMFLDRIGRTDEGLAAARTAVELDPLHPGAYNNLAVILRNAGRLDEAHEAYLNALRVSPEDPIILSNLANLMSRQERWDEALAYLDRSDARMPRTSRAWRCARTSCCVRAGRTRGWHSSGTSRQGPMCPATASPSCTRTWATSTRSWTSSSRPWTDGRTGPRGCARPTRSGDTPPSAIREAAGAHGRVVTAPARRRRR
jgi:TolB-like protein/DNA-binding SARP family transcriptional activator/Flp pilus assembly protein TadD